MTNWMQADFYLDSCGRRISRNEFAQENAEWTSVLCILADGIDPLVVAILTGSARGFYALDFSDVYDTLNEFLVRNNYLDEVDDPVAFESIQMVALPARMPQEV